jgi:uncharacterized membrane protein YqjE
MNEASTQTGTEAAPPDDEESIKDSFTGLISSARQLVEAEVEWAKIKAGIVSAALQKGAVFGGLALFLALVGALLLVVAAVIALAPIVGWLWAALIVAAAAFIFAGLLGLAAKNALASAFERDE